MDVAARVDVGTARVMFVNFAIQGLNDLFATPDDDYQPPRSYTKLTMRDEAASYSSRPGSEENSVGDGYAFTIDAHRRYGIPQMWAMNGGLATLLAHDCPDDVAAMRRDVEAGLLVPVVAGYGAHRLPYYTAGTNVDAIRFGARILEEVLGAARPVYYPDQRLTTCKDNVAGALRSAGMEYVVVDAGTGQGAVPEGAEEAGGNTAIAHAKPPMGALHDGRWMNWQYVWRDRRSGTKVLFIDKEMKDGLFAADGDTADRGKPAQAIRCKLLELASAPVVHAGNVVVYSDDADKASGNGWFDGGYDTRAANNFRYQAVLSWLATHPWVEVVTTDDLTDADVVGELDLLRASDPYIEEQWRLPNPPADGHDNGLAYDTWYAAWAGTPAAWLGETLRAVSDRAEQAHRARQGPTTRTTRTSCCCSPACTSSCACTSRSGRSGRGSSPATTVSTTARTSSPPSRCSCATRTCTWRRATGRGGRATAARGRTATTGRWWRRSRRRASRARHPRGGGPSRRGCTGTTTR